MESTQFNHSGLAIKEQTNGKEQLHENFPLVSLVTPAYNESTIIEKNVYALKAYMEGLEDRYRWEILIVNDGSKDGTKEKADQLANDIENVTVIHHRTNKNLGGAMRTGFSEAKGDIVIVLDLDLSYNEEHIERLLKKMEETEADIVIASPYMKGGKNTAVPFKRLMLSKVVNRLMRVMAPSNIYTFTSMVRAYRGSFLKYLNLKSSTYSINPEIIQKALILRAKVVEIPAHLDWSFQEKAAGRTSSIRIFKGILGGLMSAFIFRPYAFFMGVGTFLMAVALYVVIWIFINTFRALPTINESIIGFENRFGEAVAQVFIERPYSFVVGGITLIIALQFLSMGFLSLQNKRYFDELFHLNSNVLKNQKED